MLPHKMVVMNRIELKLGSNVIRKRKIKSRENIVSELFHEYCSHATLHGVGYLGEKNKNLVEKTWWIIVVILSIICCSYLISRTWIKWNNNPVIISFEQEQTHIWEIPFPAVTLCPVNKVQQLKYNYTKLFRKRDNLEGKVAKKFWDISMICNLEQYGVSIYSKQNFTDESATTNIFDVGPSLQDTFFQIYWQNVRYPLTDKLFTEQLTEHGICFTFNSFSQDEMYTNQINTDIRFINHSITNSGWKLEGGYPPDSNMMKEHPRRTAKDGSNYGLAIRLLQVNSNTDYVCAPGISGYKIIIHNPAETPRPTQQYFLVPVSKQVTLIVRPELTTTAESLRSMSPSVRKCYFSNEKSLKYFQVYTQSNCRTECSVNVTQHYCGCVPFYLPHEKGTVICGFNRMKCIYEAGAQILEYEMQKNGLDTSHKVESSETYKIFTKCNCQPSCSDLQFTAETSHTESHVAPSLLASGLYDKNGDAYKLVDKLRNGEVEMSQVDIFFKESQFLALHRSELYGNTDFLANCGGLLGLFMGFSILSLIEIVYFSTIRLWIKLRDRKRKIFVFYN